MRGMPLLRTSALLVGGDEHPPVRLVHVASNSGRVWVFWQEELARLVVTCDRPPRPRRQRAADLGATGMMDYADDVGKNVTRRKP